MVTSSVLALCPNLESMDVKISASAPEAAENPTFYRYMQTRIAKTGNISVQGSTFPLLQKLVVDTPCRHTSESFGLERLGFLLDAAPNMQSLFLVHTTGRIGGAPISSKLSWPGIAKLQQLHLQGYRRSTALPVAYDSIRGLMEQAPYMDTFTFFAVSHEVAWSRRNPFSPARLLQALLPARQSIANLAIFTSFIFVEDTVKVAIGPILQQFTNLTSLNLDEQCFCHHWIDTTKGGYHDYQETCLVDVLPVSIEHPIARLHDRSRTVKDVICLGHTAGSFPRLQSVTVEFGDEILDRQEGRFGEERID
ncbi:hypothetical protein VHEMI02099 [[Torrubiella] hemipterigena]|uniref:F-box domain-containing protein n=1 Tax=[Torrubiella] hemipterigena TaxID=1531966 RepID=A0A0A1T756_9HYPO|nr:hypothetical protein VHEMI02099 [[Torrubiella] hemipterigena]